MNGNGLRASVKLRRSGSFGLDLSLAIPTNTTVAVLGPNGAGKSTLVAAIAGLLGIDEGHIELAGITLDDPAQGKFVPAERRKLGVVFQDDLLFPHFTALENVAFGPRSRGIGRADSRARARKWLERVELHGLEDRKPAELSGGQRQRVALARALVTEPDLLILDEPLSALDVTTRAQVRRSLADHLRSFPGPRLLITHDPTEAFLLADQIHVIEDGIITQSGTPDDIRLRPRTAYAADLAGSNLVTGAAKEGVVDTGTHQLHIADRNASGPVLTTISPAAISVYRMRPEGSPRNTWEAEVQLIEQLGDRVRLRIGEPLALTVEITKQASDELRLAAGQSVWVSIKATEIAVQQAL